MVLGLVAAGLAFGATAQFSMSTAHASTSDPSVWINERAPGPYYSLLSPTALMGADCSYTFNPFTRSVSVHAPMAQSGGAPAKLAWWVRLYNYQTGGWYSDWYPAGTFTLPANASGLLGGGMTFAGWPATSFNVSAQIYVRSYDVNTNAELGHAVLNVTQYSSSGYNAPAC
jgi:hypothetical protein